MNAPNVFQLRIRAFIGCIEKKTKDVKLIYAGNLKFSGNGTITTDVLRELVKELDDTLTDQQLDEVVAEMDNDGSGALDFDGKQCLICLD